MNVLVSDNERNFLRSVGLLNNRVIRKLCRVCGSQRSLDHDNWHYYLEHKINKCDECVHISQREYDSGPNGREHKPERKQYKKDKRHEKWPRVLLFR